MRRSILGFFNIVFSVPLLAQCWVSSARFFLAPVARSVLAALWNWGYDERQSTWYEVAKLDLTHVSSWSERAGVGFPRSIVFYAREEPAVIALAEPGVVGPRPSAPYLYIRANAQPVANYRFWPGVFAFQGRGRRVRIPSCPQLPGAHASHSVPQHRISSVRGATMGDWGR